MNSSWTIPNILHWSISQDNLQPLNKKTPYYRQFRDYFAAMIEEGSLKSGEKLPSERTLSDKFSITRVTVRQALSRMEAEGLIFREQRRGWYISPPRIAYDPTINTNFTKISIDQGREVCVRLLFAQEVRATNWLASVLGCKIGERVYIVCRVRSVDGRAILVEQMYLKAKSCPDLLSYKLDRSMTDLLADKFDIKLKRSKIKMRPTALPEMPAKELGVSAGTPSLYLSRVLYDQYEEIVEFDQEFWRHDAIDISVSAKL